MRDARVSRGAPNAQAGVGVATSAVSGIRGGVRLLTESGCAGFLLPMPGNEVWAPAAHADVGLTFILCTLATSPVGACGPVDVSVGIRAGTPSTWTGLATPRVPRSRHGIPDRAGGYGGLTTE